jgi:tetratricopeptide (TPR) repeat protein
MRASAIRRALLPTLMLFAGLMFSPALATADDRAVCENRDTLPDPRITACSARLSHNDLKGKELAITLRNRGQGYAAKRDFDRAIADYDRAIEVDPTDAKSFDWRGGAYFGRRDYDRAIADYDQAIKLDPKNAVTFRNRGVAYRAKRDFDHALADLTQALQINPTDRDSIFERGLTYENKGDYDRGIADFSEVIRIDPKFASAYMYRGVLYGAKGDLNHQKSDFDAGIALRPEQANYYNARAGMWTKKGDYDQAFADVAHAMQLAPAAPYLFNTRGEIWSAKGDLDHAIADYTEALSRAPNYALAYVNRGKAYRLKGDVDRAMIDLNEVIRRYPTYGMAFAERGLAFRAKGDEEHARSDFEQATALPANNDNARKEVAAAREQLAMLTQTAPVAPNVASALPVARSDPGRRIALVIGNSAYTAVPALPNPQRDAATVAETLRSLGFQKVTLENNLTREGIFNALRAFASDAEQADWAIVYYAGHGIEMGGTNYLIPVDAKLATDRDVEFEAVSLDKVMTAVDGAKKLRLVLLDACRDNPFANQMRRSIASRSIGRGLAQVEPDAGTLVVYAAKNGETALDGTGANSPFVTALVNRMKTPGLEVRRMFDLVRDDVLEATSRHQQPFSYGSISGAEDFYFVRK